MDSLKELYSKKLNIMKYFREQGECQDGNSMDAVLCAYDYQAGDYTRNYYSEKLVKDTYVWKEKEEEAYKKVDLTSGEFTRFAAKSIAKEMKALEFNSILEVGIGEATTICDILLDLPDKKNVYGIELSLSRLYYAREFVEQKKVSIELAVGDMFSLPFEDDSVDLVFTYYCIDAHRGKEKQALEEMLRVSRKYIILVEPTYELGNEETKKRIDEQRYINNLVETLSSMNVKILEHRLFDIFTYNNNSAITILEKTTKKEKEMKKIFYACPNCKKKLIKHEGNYFCENCYNVYPVLNNIPILLENNAVLCSKYLEF